MSIRECDHCSDHTAELMSLVDHEFTGDEVRAINKYMADLEAKLDAGRAELGAKLSNAPGARAMSEPTERERKLANDLCMELCFTPEDSDDRRVAERYLRDYRVKLDEERSAEVCELARQMEEQRRRRVAAQLALDEARAMLAKVRSP